MQYVLQDIELIVIELDIILRNIQRSVFIIHRGLRVYHSVFLLYINEP